MPNAFKAIQDVSKNLGVTAFNAGKIRYGLPAAGAAIGGARGYAKAEEGNKGTGAVVGAVTGGLMGAGAAWGVNKLPTLGKQFTKDFKPIGEALKRTGANQNLTYKELGNKILDRGTQMTSENWIKMPAPGAKMKDMFGGMHEVEQLRMNTRGMAANAANTILESAKAMRDGGISGVGKHLWKDFKSKQMFEKTTNGVAMRAQRSALGKIVNPLMASGIGMGAMDALTATNKDGSKASLGKRVRKGVTSTLGWGLAPPVMAGKLVYDTSKSLIGGHKPQQDLNNQGVV